MHASLTSRLAEALKRRQSLLDARDTNCYRLLIGPKEGVPALVADRYGEVVILQQFDQLAPANVEAAAQFYSERLGVRAVYLKRFVRDRAGASEDIAAELRSPEPLLGDRVPEEIIVLENDRRFAIRPYDGFSVGLFLDQRDNRARVAEMGSGKDVLNLFSYTCTFSVAAAAGGASSTTSVDISPRSLEWGRRNFAVNQIPLGDHLFFKSDAAAFLKRAKRPGRSYDLIILDPPSFAHARRGAGSFSIERDLTGLIAGATEVLRPHGWLLVSTNHRQTTLIDLEGYVKNGVGPRDFVIRAKPPLPLDFAPDPDHARSIWIQMA